MKKEKVKELLRKLTEKLVYIKGGGFWMGCTEGDSECESNESPRHYVNVKSFYMDKYEVTTSEYRKCVESGKCSEPDTGGDCNWGSGRDEHPINCIDWEQAKAYCNWAGKRLPTEAEWEYAARKGRNDWEYPWGNDINHNNANYDGLGGRDKWEYTSPVGSFSPNGYGLYDIAGNVWEWVEDCWNESYNGAPTDGSAWLSGNCNEAVLRGGSWYSESELLRISDRYWTSRSGRYRNVGFRCARTD